jgi:hypothetical protein
MKYTAPFLGQFLLIGLIAYTGQTQPIRSDFNSGKSAPLPTVPQPTPEQQNKQQNKSPHHYSRQEIDAATYGSGYLSGGECICWRYVKNKIPQYPDGGTPAAFKEAGFKQLRHPEPGAIALYEPNTFRTYPNYGHVEIIDRIQNGIPIVRTSGANVPLKMTDGDCPNVQEDPVPELTQQPHGVTFWKLS